MIRSTVQKGLKESPLLFGIKGNFIMPFVGAVVILLLLMIVACVFFSFRDNYGAVAITVFLTIAILMILFTYLRKISVEKPFRKISSKPDIISNRDLDDFIH